VPEKPTLSKSLIHTESPLLVLDLSIPKNVDDDVLDLPNVTRIHIDELSRITDNTLAERQKEIPKAEAIIEEVVEEFTDWLGTRSFAPTGAGPQTNDGEVGATGPCPTPKKTPTSQIRRSHFTLSTLDSKNHKSRGKSHAK
jgi:hypothetical protein